MWPPGGWKFTQPQTGWSMPSGLGFHMAVQTIIQHRLQNPRFKLATDKETVADELDAYTCAILKHDPNYCIDVSQQPFIPPLPVTRQPAGANRVSALKENAVAASKFIKNSTIGIRSWIEWFGNGQLASQSLADRRAGICVSCPQNTKGDLMERFGASVGMEILEIFTTLNNLDTHTKLDDRLHICNVCSCPLKAKVWCPIEIATKHLDDKAKSKLPDFCWLLKES